MVSLILPVKKNRHKNTYDRGKYNLAWDYYFKFTKEQQILCPPTLIAKKYNCITPKFINNRNYEFKDFYLM